VQPARDSDEHSEIQKFDRKTKQNHEIYRCHKSGFAIPVEADAAVGHALLKNGAANRVFFIFTDRALTLCAGVTFIIPR